MTVNQQDPEYTNDNHDVETMSGQLSSPASVKWNEIEPPVGTVGNSSGSDSDPSKNGAVATTATASKKQPRGRLRHVVCSPLERFGKKWPRLFHLIFRVLVPLFVLIGVSFLCGYFLARLESRNEISNNNGIFAAFFNRSLTLSSAVHGRYVPDPCIADWDVNDEAFNETGLRNFLDECSAEISKINRDDSNVDDVTFDWILCGDDPTTWNDQYEHFVSDWTQQYFAIVEELTSGGMSFQDANEVGIQLASGEEDCRVHTAAGALFWFTVMTTIGYGNTAPSTVGGRAMVYTLGFLSILLFAAIISSAGSICLAVCDDFFLRIKAKRLTKGLFASIFWLAMLVLWICVLAAIYVHYHQVAVGSSISYTDSFWFSYISITTVGLGDIYIPPETFQASDMFTLPFSFLLGFVLMANFLLKLTEWLSEKLPHWGGDLEQVLEERRNLSTDDASENMQQVSCKKQERKESLSIEVPEMRNLESLQPESISSLPA